MTTVSKQTTTVGTYLLDRLHDLGVEHIFGIPGDYVLRFDQIIESHPITYINATRENTAGYMADAYARLKGIGVACITYGVGINITNAVSQAFVESSPLVIISGAPGDKEFNKSQPLHHLFHTRSGSRDNTQMEIFKKITVWQCILDKPEEAAAKIDEALWQCTLHKKPIYIELPRDCVDSPIAMELPKERELPHSDQEALNEALEEIGNLLKNCKRPLIWAGHEIQRFSLAGPLLRFAEKFRIPIASSLLGKSAIDERHPLYMGIYQGKLSREDVLQYIEGSDLVFICGVVQSDVETGIFTADLKNKNRVILGADEVAVNHHHYIDACFHDLIYSLEGLDLNIRYRGDYPAYLDKKKGEIENDKVTTAMLFNILDRHLNNHHLLVSDFGDCLFGSMELTLGENNFISNAYFASLGFGVPAAVGAAVACPEKRVIGVVGDGAFQMTCTELATAVRYHLDPIIILLNNHGYATERPLIEGEFNNILDWKYSKIPQVLGGGTGAYVKTKKELEDALKKAFADRGQFHLIEVDLDKNDYSPGLKRFCNLVNLKKNKHS